jgi:hypothetical protein
MVWGVAMVLSLVLMASAQDLDEFEEEEDDMYTTPEPMPQTTAAQQIIPRTSETAPIGASPMFLILVACAMLYTCVQH